MGGSRVGSEAGGWVSPTLILLTSIALGCARAMQMPAQQALLPALVPPVLLPRMSFFPPCRRAMTPTWASAV